MTNSRSLATSVGTGASGAVGEVDSGDTKDVESGVVTAIEVEICVSTSSTLSDFVVSNAADASGKTADFFSGPASATASTSAPVFRRHSMNQVRYSGADGITLGVAAESAVLSELSGVVERLSSSCIVVAGPSLCDPNSCRRCLPVR